MSTTQRTHAEQEVCKLRRPHQATNAITTAIFCTKAITTVSMFLQATNAITTVFIVGSVVFNFTFEFFVLWACIQSLDEGNAEQYHIQRFSWWKEQMLWTRCLVWFQHQKGFVFSQRIAVGGTADKPRRWQRFSGKV